MAVDVVVIDANKDAKKQQDKILTGIIETKKY